VSSDIHLIRGVSLAIGDLNRLSSEIFDCKDWKITNHITLVLVKNIGKFLAFPVHLDCLVKNRKYRYLDYDTI
jgi:hypothetical protein